MTDDQKREDLAVLIVNRFNAENFHPERLFGTGSRIDIDLAKRVLRMIDEGFAEGEISDATSLSPGSVRWMVELAKKHPTSRGGDI